MSTTTPNGPAVPPEVEKELSRLWVYYWNCDAYRGSEDYETYEGMAEAAMKRIKELEAEYGIEEETNPDDDEYT